MLVLSTLTNPGAASWQPLPSPSGGQIFAASAPSISTVTGAVSASPIPITGQAITIPANTIQPGDLLVYSFLFSLDTSTGGNTYVVGVRIDNGFVIPWDVFTLVASPIAPGDVSNGVVQFPASPFDGFIPASIVAFGTGYSSTQGSGTALTLDPFLLAQSNDYTLPITFTPLVQVTQNDATLNINVANTALQIFRP